MESHEAIHNAKWRGIAKECFADGEPGAHIISAVVFGAELAKTLDATLTDRYRVGPDATEDRRQFATASGATIDVDIPAASVVVAGDDHRCDVTMLPDRVAIDFHGNHGGEGMLALYLLDLLHEQGELPTSGKHLSGGDLVMLSEMRDSLVDDDDPDPESHPA